MYRNRVCETIKVKIINPEYQNSLPVLLSPDEEETRHPAPDTTRMYAGARVTRLDKDLGESGEINRSLYESLTIMRQRSRQLSIDDPCISKFLTLAQQETLGPKGLKLSVNGPDEKVNKVIEELYNDWSDDCCTSGDMSLLDFEKLAVRTRHCDGEFFCRIVPNFSKNEFRYALFPFDADRLELGFDAGPRPDGSFIRNSIEYDKWLRPLAYHVLTRHPGESIRHWPDGQFRMRIPADEILHFFEPLRPGQGRGLPSTHAVLLTAKQLKEYIKATIVAARVISSKFAAITTKNPDPFQNPNLGKPNVAKGELINKVEAGRIFNLQAGQSLETFDPKQPSGEFSPFITAITRRESSGLNVSYSSLSGDQTGTSFASGRLEALLNASHWSLERTTFNSRLKLKNYKKWLPWAFLTQPSLSNIVSGSELKIYMKATTVYDKPSVWIDPDVTSKVIERNLNNGITTYRDELAKLNIDYQAHIKQLLIEKADFEKIFPGGSNEQKKTSRIRLITERLKSINQADIG